MAALLFSVIPLGIGAAFTPSLFALQLLIVGNDPWRTKALAAFLGSAVAFGIAVTILLLGFAQLPTTGSSTDLLDGVIRLVAAALLGAAAIYFFIPTLECNQKYGRVSSTESPAPHPSTSLESLLC